ncbi:hypothetical protein VCRA2119O44_140137 [Vibrio crassostreae]|nr:hypothetical protein VCRA2119O47_140002 [Vibrio crassostreae]CAK1771950.1 hypothetical protein VCRA2119O44_140137 [Vibrio crassostreae]CAK2369253.1 hypothetical protein VCRA2119O50_40137 [Vibrio crassostreae]
MKNDRHHNFKKQLALCITLEETLHSNVMSYSPVVVTIQPEKFLFRAVWTRLRIKAAPKNLDRNSTV